MQRIASFCVDHLRLEPGVYISRKDEAPFTCNQAEALADDNNKCIVTTFDIRMTTPNKEPVMDTAAVHAIEHLGATYLRNNSEWKDRILYFGPMGCRTGFYMLVFGDLESKDVVPLLIDMFEFCSKFEGEIPGAAPQECGNYHDSDLGMAKWHSRKYLDNTLLNIDEKHMVYPEY